MCWKAKSHQICILKGLRLMLRLLLLLLFNSRGAFWSLAAAPLFLVTFRLDYASFLTEMEVDVKARMKAGIWRRSFAFGDQLSHFQLPFGKVSCRKGWWRLLRSTCNRVEGFCWSKTFFHDFQNWTSETLFLFSTQCIFSR